jgi:hypothetical protein
MQHATLGWLLNDELQVMMRRCTDVKVSCHNPSVIIKSISTVVSELHSTVNIILLQHASAALYML